MSDDHLMHIDYDLLARYLNSECNSEEAEQVEGWINASVEHQQEFEKLSKAWDLAGSGAGFEKWDAQGSKEQFLLKVIQNQAVLIHEKEQQVQIKRLQVRNLWKYAAAAILIIGISGILVFTFPGSHQNGAFTEVAVSKGSKSQMTLPDGSQVWLNADSKIKYTGEFNTVDRNIFLEGEAYFEVAKNPSKTFRVNAGGLIVEAVGTAFNVKAYPEENVVEATLLEGSVKIGLESKPAQRMLLKPDEQVFYYKPDQQKMLTEKMLISKGIESKQFTSWINGQITINSETLESLVVKLDRKYDVKFHFDDPDLKKLRFTGVFKDETIEQILEVLKLSSPVNYRIQEREIWLSRKPGSSLIQDKSSTIN
jgi:ferric-dicitrate binding protein FerR (iron transport regulator)